MKLDSLCFLPFPTLRLVTDNCPQGGPTNHFKTLEKKKDFGDVEVLGKNPYFCSLHYLPNLPFSGC